MIQTNKHALSVAQYNTLSKKIKGYNDKNLYIIHMCVCVVCVFCILDFVVFSEALPLAPCLIKWSASPTSSCKMDEWRNLKTIQKKIENPIKWSTPKKIENPKKWSTQKKIENPKK